MRETDDEARHVTKLPANCICLHVKAWFIPFAAKHVNVQVKL